MFKATAEYWVSKLRLFWALNPVEHQLYETGKFKYCRTHCPYASSGVCKAKQKRKRRLVVLELKNDYAWKYTTSQKGIVKGYRCVEWIKYV